MDRLAKFHRFVIACGIAAAITFTALPALADAPAVAMPAALSARSVAAQAASGPKFCGYDLFNSNGTSRRLTDLRSLQGMLDRARFYDFYTRRGAGFGEYSGHILWGYNQAVGFEPLYFVPANVKPGEC